MPDLPLRQTNQGYQVHGHRHHCVADQTPHLSGHRPRLHRGVQQVQTTVHWRYETHSRIQMGGTPRVREEQEVGPGQPPGSQYRPHDVLRPGEDQQQQPAVQEGQGITFNRKSQPKLRRDECQDIEQDCTSQLL